MAVGDSATFLVAERRPTTAAATIEVSFIMMIIVKTTRNIVCWLMGVGEREVYKYVRPAQGSILFIIEQQ